MRILRLDGPEPQRSYELHPFVTVLFGLSHPETDELCHQIRQIVAGNYHGFSGLIEQGGSLVDLDATATGPTRLVGVDVVIDADADAPSETTATPAEIAQLDQMAKQLEVLAVSIEAVRFELNPQAVYDVSRLTKERTQLTQGQSVDLTPLRELMTAVAETPPVLQTPAASAQACLQLWAAFTASRDAVAPRLAELDLAVRQARQALDDANVELAAAERQAVPVLLAPEEEERLDALAMGTDDGRRRRAKQTTLSEEAGAEIDALLAKANQPSYTAYVLHRTDPQPSPAAQAALKVAQELVESATYSVAEAEAEAEIDPALETMRRREAEVRAAATQLLGPALPDDLEPVLAGMVDESVNPVWQEANERLLAESITLGLVGNDEQLTDEELLAVVTERLAQTGPNDIQGSLARIDEALLVATQDASRHQRAKERLVEMEEAAVQLDAVRRHVTDLIAARGQRTNDGVTLEELRHQVHTLCETLTREAGGSVPLVVRGAFASLDDQALDAFMDWVLTISDRAQIVVVTDRQAALEWANRVGIGEAMVAGPGIGG